MELLFAENLRRFRRERNLTQEQLADALGISPQSVSKWERSDGYPDITLLPRIAEYFGVSVDTLLGSDEESRQADLRRFLNTVRGTEDEDERLRLCLEYTKQHPENDDAAHELCWVITTLPQKKREPYLPLLRDTCKKILERSTQQVYRENAVKILCRICEEHELETWLELCAQEYKAYKGEVLEERFMEQKQWDACRLRNGINTLQILQHFLFRSHCSWKDADCARKWNEYRLHIIETFAVDGEIPRGWLCAYAMNHIRLASALFGGGEKEEGYRALERGLDLFEKWTAIPDGTALELGEQWLFRGVKAVKDGWTILLPDGTEEYSNLMSEFLNWSDFPLRALTGPNWEEFDAVREEERYREAVRRARKMAGAE